MVQGIRSYAAVASPSSPGVAASLKRVEALVETARAAGATLVVLPECAIGGYLRPDGTPGQPLELDSPEIARLCALAGETVVCAGFTEAPESVGGRPYSSAVCVWGDGVLGHHRKVHLPPSEGGAFAPGESFAAFDTPLGRLGMLLCYDKVFPEAARTLALDGAELIASLSAWPLCRTAPARRIAADRQTRHFNLLDEARAVENQVVWLSSNLTGRIGPLRFLGQAKVVDPDGAVLARTGGRSGIALAELDLSEARAGSLAAISHLADRAIAAYELDQPAPLGALPAAAEPPPLEEPRVEPAAEPLLGGAATALA